MNKSKERAIDLRKSYRGIVYSMMEKCEASCLKCKCIYFQPMENSIIAQKIETYLSSDGRRILDYNGTTYLALDFMRHYSQSLEFRVIHLDHLPETEQRSRGLLGINDPFICKVKDVSQLHSYHCMKVESLKTQNLCVLCHLEETVAREQGLMNKTSKATNIKCSYINDLKSQGCSSCGYKNPLLFRFFDMDHLDPRTKIKSLCTMAHYPEYSLEDVITECGKCRVLCKHCHSIYSSIQRRTRHHG